MPTTLSALRDLYVATQSVLDLSDVRGLSPEALRALTSRVSLDLAEALRNAGIVIRHEAEAQADAAFDADDLE
jgi:hypothetical protein